MNNFTFYAPTYFAFGKDTENETGKYVKRFGGSRVLIHSRVTKKKVTQGAFSDSCFVGK